MKKIALTLLLLLISAAAMSQTYSNASLSGKYSLQIQTPNFDTWSKTFTCPTNSAVTYTPSSSMTTTEVAYGLVTFDGAGNFSASTTTIGKANLTASANSMSVTWNSSCQVTKVNYGHLVYLASATKTSTGTYAVSSSGTGTLTITGQSGGLTIQLTAPNSAGVATTVLMTSTPSNGQAIGTGIAILQ